MRKSAVYFICITFFLFHLGQTLGQAAEDSAKTSRQFFFSSLQKDSLSLSEIPKLVDGIKTVNFVSGSIFLSGEGFANVISFLLPGPEMMLHYLPKFKRGSRITIENGRFRPGKTDKPLLIRKTYIIID